jgi:uracil-DNA glycosylase
MNTFPFGSILIKVEQKYKSPKKVFILGAYASAVHAKWIGTNNKVKVKALAIASEPYIFWKGDDCDKIIKSIKIPKELGHLDPADSMFNGPSGLTLDNNFLKPLGLTRDDVWLCDIIPYTRINPQQRAAINNHYNPFVRKYNLLKCTIPDFRKQELDNVHRRYEIIKELEQSQARVVILLGDLPIRYFLSYYSDERKSFLKDFGIMINRYGNLNPIMINSTNYQILPLVHPRQAGKLGRHDKVWSDLHEEWIEKKAPAYSIYFKSL